MIEAMTFQQQVLAFAWWLALWGSLLVYIALDGADLGAGIFSLFVKDEHERGAIMAAMAGTWDANETWLVVAGGILFGTFPFVYGSALSYLMIPLIFVLWGIMIRALSIELRHLASPRWRRFSDWCFGLSSLAVTFFGGMAVGAFLLGFPLTSRPGQLPIYSGSSLAFITPFSLWVGIASVVAVTLSGVLFVRARFAKTEPIRAFAVKWTMTIYYLALLAVAATAAWSALIFPWAYNKWFGPHAWVWWTLLLLALLAIYQMRRATRQDRDLAAILWFNACALIMGGSMMATLFPWLVPNTWTIWQGASPQVSLVTFSMAMAGFLPVIVMLNVYQIWVFRARITKLSNYH